MPFFKSGDQYIPTNNTLRMKFTRENQRKFLTMSEHNYVTAATDFSHGVANALGDDARNLGKLDGVKVNFNEIYMYFKHVTPDDMIQSQINLLMEKQG